MEIVNLLPNDAECPPSSLAAIVMLLSFELCRLETVLVEWSVLCLWLDTVDTASPRTLWDWLWIFDCNSRSSSVINRSLYYGDDPTPCVYYGFR
jgi:hypothetical protein